MKLTIEHLAPYFPYKLKWMFEGSHAVYEVVGLEMSWEGLILLSPDGSFGRYNLNRGKPILRPLSDLTKEIEHNGKRFVPIVELFKLKTHVTGSEIHDYYIENNTAILRLKGQQFEDYTFKCFFEIDLEPNQVLFSIASETWKNDEMTQERLHQCGNEMLMYQKLHGWHFDVFGLIEKGLAIDRFGPDDLEEE